MSDTWDDEEWVVPALNTEESNDTNKKINELREKLSQKCNGNGNSNCDCDSECNDIYELKKQLKKLEELKMIEESERNLIDNLFNENDVIENKNSILSIAKKGKTQRISHQEKMKHRQEMERKQKEESQKIKEDKLTRKIHAEKFGEYKLEDDYCDIESNYLD